MNPERKPANKAGYWKIAATDRVLVVYLTLVGEECNVYFFQRFDELRRRRFAEVVEQFIRASCNTLIHQKRSFHACGGHLHTTCTFSEVYVRALVLRVVRVNEVVDEFLDRLLCRSEQVDGFQVWKRLPSFSNIFDNLRNTNQTQCSVEQRQARYCAWLTHE